jgi:hypothetical protein
MELVNWISNAGRLVFFVVACVALLVFLRWRMRGGSQKALEKQNQLLEQQLVVLREISETLKQLRESRG